MDVCRHVGRECCVDHFDRSSPFVVVQKDQKEVMFYQEVGGGFKKRQRHLPKGVPKDIFNVYTEEND